MNHKIIQVDFKNKKKKHVLIEKYKYTFSSDILKSYLITFIFFMLSLIVILFLKAMVI